MDFSRSSGGEAGVGDRGKREPGITGLGGRCLGLRAEGVRGGSMGALFVRLSRAWRDETVGSEPVREVEACSNKRD